MRKIFRNAVSLALTLALSVQLGAGALAAGLGEARLTDSQTLTDGLRYERSVLYAGDGSRVESHTLTVAPTSEVRPIVMACDTIYGGLTVEQCIAYAGSLGYNVVGGMNADFGYWSTRIPCGTVVEDGIYKSSPEQCNALALTEEGGFVSLLPEVVTTLEHEGEAITLTHFNKTREPAGGLYLYSEHFSTVSTRTTGEGWALRLRVLSGEMTLSGEAMTLVVEEKYEGSEPLPIGEGNLILTAGAESGLEVLYERFEVGDTVTLQNSVSDARLMEADWVTGCGNILVHEGELYVPEGWDSTIAGKHPRSCVGIKPDGTLIFRVVDGRSSVSAGATLMQLAEEFLTLGCTEAVNLDGGGSSVLTLRTPGRDGQTLRNHPSDGSLRSVPSFILFVTEAEPDGAAQRLFLEQDNALVLTGSSLPLSLTAWDKALLPASVPEDARAASAGGLGEVDAEGVYRAGDTPGTETLLLGSEETGLTGEASLHIIDRADTLIVTDPDTGYAPAERLYLDEGETQAFTASVTYEGRPVAMDPEAVSYTVEGEIGTVDEDGVFTASDIWAAEGCITLAAAGLTKSWPVRVGAVFDDIGKHWARPFIETLYARGVVKGVTETSFYPDAPMKRADFMLMLYRAAGSPELPESPEEMPEGAEVPPEEEVPEVSAAPEEPEAEERPSAPEFEDVPEGAYYAEAVIWAAHAGIAQGMGDGLFRPEETLTREQAFAFVLRALPVLGVVLPEPETPEGGEEAVPPEMPEEEEPSVLESFPDGEQVQSWAREAAEILITMGVIEGSEGKLEPQGSLTRAQMAKILLMVTQV